MRAHMSQSACDSRIFNDTDRPSRVHVRNRAHPLVVGDWEAVGFSIWEMIQVDAMQVTEFLKSLSISIAFIENS